MLDSVSYLRELEQSRLRKAQDSLADLTNRITLHLEAISLCEKCLEEQSDIRKYIEEQVTALLQKVFSYSYSFQFLAILREDGVSLKGLKPQVVKDGVADDPKTYGGGVQNVVSFALRLIYLLFTKRLSKVLILDEPLLNLNEEKWVPLLEFIVDLQKHFKVQIIVITHADVEFPTTYKVYRSGKTSFAEQLIA